MTKDQLDNIRARVAKIYYNGGGFDGCFIDVTNLLAEVERLKVEVERLTAELDMEDGNLQVAVQRLTTEVVAKTQQNVALIGQNGRLQQEVERLNALGAFQSADIQRLTRRVAEDEADWMALRAEAATAFQRGAKAMREVVIKSVTCHFPTINAGGNCGLCTFCDAALDKHIRDLPDPEDKP